LNASKYGANTWVGKVAAAAVVAFATMTPAAAATVVIATALASIGLDKRMRAPDKGKTAGNNWRIDERLGRPYAAPFSRMPSKLD
jgi:hypothetical protein